MSSRSTSSRSSSPRSPSSRSALFFVAASLFSTSGCFAVINGSGVADTEVREHTDFVRVDNRSALATRVDVGADFAVRVRCDDNLIEYISTRVDDDTLVIEKENHEAFLNPRTDCAVEVGLPSLAAFESSGSGAANVGGDVVDLASVVSSGSGAVTVRDIESDAVDVESSGSGAVTLEGIATVVEIESSGSGSVDAASLVADEVVVRASGSGSVSVSADTKADIALSGSGSVTVEGNPSERDVDDSGSGTVRFE